MKPGTSFTAVTVITNDCDPLVSNPPFAEPPLSDTVSVIVAAPFAFAAGVYVRAPSVATVGPAENKPGLVLPVMLNVTVCPASSAGPLLIAVAHGVTVCAPESSNTD